MLYNAAHYTENGINYDRYVFDYDIDMIYNQREYLEEQIAKAEYPVMVDKLIRK